MKNHYYESQRAVGPTNKKKSLKLKIYSLFLVILIGTGAYGYFWYQEFRALRIEAERVVGRATQLESVLGALVLELNRCEKFISQKEGDFGSFEYCKKFIEWVNLQESMRGNL